MLHIDTTRSEEDSAKERQRIMERGLLLENSASYLDLVTFLSLCLRVSVAHALKEGINSW